MQQWTRIFLRSYPHLLRQDFLPTAPQALMMPSFRRLGVSASNCVNSGAVPMNSSATGDYSSKKNLEHLQGSLSSTSASGNADEWMPSAQNLIQNPSNSVMRRLDVDDQAAKRVVDEGLDTSELKLFNPTGNCLLVGMSSNSDSRFASWKEEKVWNPQFHSKRTTKNSFRSYSSSARNLLCGDPTSGDVINGEALMMLGVIRGGTRPGTYDVITLDDNDLMNLDLTDLISGGSSTLLLRGAVGEAVRIVREAKGQDSVKYVAYHRDLGHLIIGQEEKVIAVVRNHGGSSKKGATR
ncbi:unnamed protein product [Hermetia illucens]|uniref:Uncharacterized protein n=1 Tax=Hermetia illucens TaxID=343691 RepID=A0A7R8V165_HERIL|nr:unnamed protein product [Hermetia illucens]